MAVVPGPGGVPGGTGGALVAFLQDLRGLLREVVDDPWQLVPEYLVGRLREAWPEIDARFDEVMAAVDSGWHDDALAQHGLLEGPQFAFKREGFRRWLWLFRRDRSRRPLLKALGWADVILESLASAIPGGQAIAEFKQGLERAVEDEEDGDAAALAEVPEP